MSMVILDSFEEKTMIGDILKSILENKQEQYSYFKLKNLNVKRCTGCGACGVKTPGRCVIKDDMTEILRAIAKSDWIIMLTPLRFGGYSSQLKKVFDRFMTLGLPTYTVIDGRLYHVSRYGHKYLFGIALIEEILQGQEENFKKLVARNSDNLQYTSESLIIRPNEEIENIENKIISILDRV